MEDVTSANVKKLEQKVASLANTVKDLFDQFDELNEVKAKEQ